MMETINFTKTGLLDLPPELILRIQLYYLDLTSIYRLSLTCRYLYDNSNEQSIYKALVLDAVEGHVLEGKRLSSIAEGSMICSWKEQAKFILPNSHRLGFSISSTGRSRLIRTSINQDSTTSQFTINCSEIRAENIFANTTLPHASLPPLLLPHRAFFDRDNAAYHVPNVGPGSYTPDSGLAVQVLALDIKIRPLFHITKDGAELHLPTTTDHPLKIRLVGTVQEVSMKEQDEVLESVENQRLRLVRMFTGVPPLTRIFPTKHFIDCGTIVGSIDWVGERGKRKELIVEDRAGEKVARCEGFRVEIRRAVPPPPVDPVIAGVLKTLRSGRRPGVPMNGGPSILYDGQETNPFAGTPIATMVTAGQQIGQAGFTFHLNYDGDVPTPPQTHGRNTPDPSEAIIPTPLSREIFYPISRPNHPFSFSDPSNVDSHGEILAESVSGIYAGTYGPHGIEFSHVSIQHFITTGEQGEALYGRTVSCVKITGDDNVPSGQFTWKAYLPSLSLSSPTSPLLASIPTVTEETLLRWSSYDPHQTSSDSHEIPDWERGTCEGRGRIAGSLFSNPQWTEAECIFIRSSNEVKKNREEGEGEGEGEGETRMIDSVEEIRVRWLGSVATFKRVRI